MLLRYIDSPSLQRLALNLELNTELGQFLSTYCISRHTKRENSNFQVAAQILASTFGIFIIALEETHLPLSVIIVPEGQAHEKADNES